MQNNIYIPFTVSSFDIRRNDNRTVPSGNQNYIFAQFNFSANWSNLNKIAIFSKIGVDTVHSPIVDNVCKIPNEFMNSVGDIEVSVFAGDRRTVNTAIINVSKSGYKEGIPPLPSESSSIYVQTPDSSVPYIRYINNLEIFVNEKWKVITGGNGDDSEFIPAEHTSDDKGNLLTIGSDGGFFVPQGVVPYVLYLARKNGNAIFTTEKPTVNQMVIDRIWRSAIWGVWADVATLQFDKELLRVEADVVIGSIFTAKLWVSSDVAVEDVQFRLTVTDTTDNTDIAIAFAETDLNNINTQLSPLTFINKFRVTRQVPISKLLITLAVMVRTSGTQFGIASNPLDAQTSFATIFATIGNVNGYTGAVVAGQTMNFENGILKTII